MANLFLPQLITWFRLDEHVKRLKGRVDALESNPGGVQTITGTFVNNTDPLNPKIEPFNADSFHPGLMSIKDYKNLNTLENKNFPDDLGAFSGGIPVGGLYHTNGIAKVNLGNI